MEDTSGYTWTDISRGSAASEAEPTTLLSMTNHGRARPAIARVCARRRPVIPPASFLSAADSRTFWTVLRLHHTHYKTLFSFITSNTTRDGSTP